MELFFSALFSAPFPASPGMLESQVEQFTQDRSSGMIVVESGQSQAYLLYDEGQFVSGCLREGLQAKPTSSSELLALCQADEFSMRSAALSGSALRLVWQALQWLPPAESLEVPASDLAVYLDGMKIRGLTGLIQYNLPGLDGFYVLRSGLIDSAESLYLISARGLETGVPNLRQQVLHPKELCQVSFYTLLEGPAADTFLLRGAFAAWGAAYLSAYQGMVGTNLLIALSYDVNTALRLKRLNMRLVGTSLVNQHLFSTAVLARDAYSSILKNQVEQISRVIGPMLTRRLFQDSFNGLAADTRQKLTQYSLWPGDLLK
jgi:hypothetical protein